MSLNDYSEAFERVNADFKQAVEDWGLKFESQDSAPRCNRAAVASACGFNCENNDGSLWQGWISPACIACRTGQNTASFYTDLRCNRDCYFCFNPNQEGYDYFRSCRRDIAAELQEAHRQGKQFDCLAITGGEPLLYPDRVLSFLTAARQLYPQAHTRLYTNGDLLTCSLLNELVAAGLTEIRFSIKPPDVEEITHDTASPENFDKWPIWQTITEAAAAPIDVVIEIPVIPGTLQWMKELLVRANAIGVRGINLLEFCFPLNNAEEFSSRGFELRAQPFNYLYDYWYGGGIPVAQSEVEALALVEFAAEQGLKCGIHYCSSDNKNTGQIFQQDCNPQAMEFCAQSYPWVTLDSTDYFYKCAKAFGPQCADAARWLADHYEGEGTSYCNVPSKDEGTSGDSNLCEGEGDWSLDESAGILSFPLALAPALHEAFPSLELATSTNVVEASDDGSLHLRELAVTQA